MAKKKVEEKKFSSDEEIAALLKIKSYKDVCEENIVGILWKEPDLYFYHDSLTLDSFTNNKWRVFWQIGYDIIVKEKKSLDENSIDIYLNKHKKLETKYNDYGGYDTVKKLEVNEKDIEGFITELEKWDIVSKMVKAKMGVAHRLKDFVDMSVEEIYDEQEAMLNHLFSNVSGEDKVYKLSDNIEQLIDQLDEGLCIGLPFDAAELLTHEIGGMSLGTVTLVGGLSGVGKSSVSRIWLLPSIIKNGEKLVIILNEEGLGKWQREMIIWVANNIFNEDVQKYKLRDGKFTKEFRDFLKTKCVKWIRENEDNIVLIPFMKYTTAKAIKTIRKYAHMGVNYFMLDTFKADNTTLSSEAFWYNMQQSMTDIYNEVKEENKNLHILVTFQLAKSSSKNRCYTQDNIGMAKNIIDVASTCLMLRNVYEDEYEGEKNELKVFKTVGKTKVYKKLDKNKHYMVVFIIKNREGASGAYQIVAECDLSRNIFKEVGYTCISPDW